MMFESQVDLFEISAVNWGGCILPYNAYMLQHHCSCWSLNIPSLDRTIYPHSPSLYVGGIAQLTNGAEVLTGTSEKLDMRSNIHITTVSDTGVLFVKKRNDNKVTHTVSMDGGGRTRIVIRTKDFPDTSNIEGIRSRTNPTVHVASNLFLRGTSPWSGG